MALARILANLYGDISRFVSVRLQHAKGVGKSREMSYDRRKVRTGRVVSNKMNRTVVVQVERQSRHRIYKKLMRKRSKLVVHDPENVAMVGDLVEVIESRPISKTKRWRLVKVLQKGDMLDVLPNPPEAQTYESPESIPDAEPKAEVQTHESPEETPVAEPEVEDQTQESLEETPVAKPEVEDQTQESLEETLVAEPEVEDQTQESLEETPVAEPEAEEQTQESPEETPAAEPEVEEQTEQADHMPFASLFFDAQTSTPSDAPASIETLPEPGPQTQQQAEQESELSRDHGRSGQHRQRTVTRWEPTEAAAELANQFREMVHGDYGKRCQVCGRSFAMTNGELQVFVVHVVPPNADDRTNHFGNLMGLCGWHYSLVRYGTWTLIDHETGEPGSDWEHMREFILNAPEQEDDAGGRYVALWIRFWNVYGGGNPDAGEVDGEIRYSIPHWIYVRQLLSE